MQLKNLSKPVIQQAFYTEPSKVTIASRVGDQMGGQQTQKTTKPRKTGL
jgi:hypothetical protein